MTKVDWIVLHGMEKTQQYGRVKLVNVIQTFSFDI